MPYIMLNTEYSDLDSGSGSGSEYIEIDYDIFNILKLHPIIYFIFSVIGFAILVCLFHICSEESRLKKNRNRGDSDSQSWADFVREGSRAVAFAVHHVGGTSSEAAIAAGTP